MNLYAFMHGERATKGQGANRELVIDLIIGPKERKEVGRVVLTYDKVDGYTIYYYPVNANCEDQKINSGRVLLYQTKGEKPRTAKSGE